MPYCTFVEFEWSDSAARDGFAAAAARLGDDATLPDGCVSRIAGFDDHGARVIEVWQSSDDARAFAESSAPALAATSMPAPSRVFGFEVSTYRVA